MYLSFVAHGNLDKHHGMTSVGILNIITLQGRIDRNRLDILPLDIHISKDSEHSEVHGLEQEQPDAEARQSLERRGNVPSTNVRPSHIDVANIREPANAPELDAEQDERQRQEGDEEFEHSALLRRGACQSLAENEPFFDRCE